MDAGGLKSRPAAPGKLTFPTGVAGAPSVGRKDCTLLGQPLVPVGLMVSAGDGSPIRARQVSAEAPPAFLSGFVIT